MSVQAEEVRGGHARPTRQLKHASSKEFQVLRCLHGGQAAAQLKQWEKGFELVGPVRGAVRRFVLSARGPLRAGWAEQNLGKLDRGPGRVRAGGGQERCARWPPGRSS